MNRRERKNNLPLNFKEKSHARLSLYISIAVLILLLIFLRQVDSVLILKPAQEARKQADQLQAEKEAEEEEAASAATVTTVSVLAVGDNLYHSDLLESGESDTGDWNYDHVYDNLREKIQAADIAIVNQETILTSEHSAVSSYPSFATPTEVGDALVNAGFDVVASATNHVDDYGNDYIDETLNFWSSSYPDISLLGIHESQEDADTVTVREVNGIRIAFLNYTYGTNNVGYFDIEDYTIDTFEKETVATAVAKAKEVSDCVIFVAHWGTEYEAMPTEYEKQWAAYLLELGVDVVIGSHPHILQPYGILSDDSGNEMLIFYSLGNFVSGQEALDRLLGGIGEFTIQKTVQNGETTIEIVNPTVEPTVMHSDTGSGIYGPLLLSDYTDDLAASHDVVEEIGSDAFTVEKLEAKFEEIMSMNVTPSTGTDLLEVTYGTGSTMLDANGNTVTDTVSTTMEEYYASEDSSDSYDDSGDSYNSSYDDSDYGDDYSDVYYNIYYDDDYNDSDSGYDDYGY
ncbi:MAG: CapA family protein [Clostridiales bacterium]|nr:CapA family protein [Clostridiales bacterium]